MPKRSSRKQNKDTTSPAPAPLPPPTPTEILEGINRKQVANAAARLQAGKTLTRREEELLKDFYVATPKANENEEADKEAQAKGAPPDIAAKTMGELADLAGLHRNSILNYKRHGIEPTGIAPWSLRDYYLLLRRHGKLGETKPSNKRAQALRSWAFSGGDSADPDDPAHDPPRGWQEEQALQGALKAREMRMKERIELETLQRERIPIAEYRERWKRRAQQVLAALDLVMGIPKAVPDLPEKQRQLLVSACRQAIHEIRIKIDGPTHGE